MPEDRASELKDQLRRDKACLAAAELDFRELVSIRERIEAETTKAEKAVNHWVDKVSNA